MNKTRKSHQAHNKENLREAEKQLNNLREKYHEVSRYFEDSQRNLEQKATEHLSYLSDIDENLPISGIPPLRNSHLRAKGESLSAWEELPGTRAQENSALGDRRKFRGFSFWAKRNSLPKERPSNQSIDGYLPKVGYTAALGYQRNRTPNEADPTTLIYEQQREALRPSYAESAIITINQDERTQQGGTASNVNYRSISRESLNVLKEKLSVSNLHGLLQHAPTRADESRMKMVPPTEIDWLKQQILNNLNRQTIINRSGHFIHSHQQAANRPKSSYPAHKRAKLPPGPAGTLVPKKDQCTNIKLSSLMKDCEVNIEPFARKAAVGRQTNRALRLSEEPKRSFTRAFQYERPMPQNSSEARLSAMKGADMKCRVFRLPCQRQ